jgi:hypothetical protein
MTQLIVEPIDMDAPGSYRKRARLLRAIQAVQEGDGLEQATALVDVEDLIIGQLSTDNGTPVDDALDELSANQFDQLLSGILGGPTLDPKTASD